MSRKSFQLKSMTAYGRALVDFKYGRFTVEIQSVNRRFLEINVSLPKFLMRYETDIRHFVTSRTGRGMVTVAIYWKSENSRPFVVKPNLSLAIAVKESWEKVAKELNLEGQVDLALLSQEKDILFYEEELEDEKEYKAALEKNVQDAFYQLVMMKEKEGQKLAADLDERITTLESMIGRIEKNAPLAVEKYRQKLTERLQEFFAKVDDNEEKILREIAIFAERIDITEEVVRFKSHLDQFRDLLVKPIESETETRGKTLDFLLQELNREINTIGAKTSEKEVGQQVIGVKSELEKMREQIQNIE